MAKEITRILYMLHMHPYTNTLIIASTGTSYNTKDRHFPIHASWKPGAPEEIQKEICKLKINVYIL